MIGCFWEEERMEKKRSFGSSFTASRVGGPRSSFAGSRRVGGLLKLFST